MSHAHFLGHLVRRGMSAVQEHSTGVPSAVIEKLQHDAQLYEDAPPELTLYPSELLPVVVTGLIVALLVASIRYTIGDVMASLAMIESPSSTAIIEPKDGPPPPYTDGADAPLEKEPLMRADAETDVEITVINHKPITSKITTTIGHLHRIGGFRARWRGLGFSMLYHFLHAVLTNLLGSFFGMNLAAQCLVYMFVSVGLARIHMLWTHSMISMPSSKPFYRRIVPRKECKAILLPSLFMALAELATVILPLGVALALNVPGMHKEQMYHTMHHTDCGKMALYALRFLAVPATALLIALAVLLPASVTLTRIEATLLPTDEATIVPFDREAIMGDIDTSVIGGRRALFVEAWRSFDRSARLRLIKLYAKMVLAQLTIVFVGVHLMVAELYLIGPEKLVIAFKSAVAQLKLMAIEAHQQQQQQGQ